MSRLPTTSKASQEGASPLLLSTYKAELLGSFVTNFEKKLENVRQQQHFFLCSFFLCWLSLHPRKTLSLLLARVTGKSSNYSWLNTRLSSGILYHGWITLETTIRLVFPFTENIDPCSTEADAFRRRFPINYSKLTFLFESAGYREVRKSIFWKRTFPAKPKED